MQKPLFEFSFFPPDLTSILSLACQTGEAVLEIFWKTLVHFRVCVRGLVNMFSSGLSLLNKYSLHGFKLQMF